MLTKTLCPILFEDVSLYMNAVPIGDRILALESIVEDFVFVDFMKFDILTLLFLSLRKIF